MTDLRQSSDNARREARAGDREDVLLSALNLIRGRSCEHFRTGLGACFTEGRRPTAYYTANRCCNACIADAAITAYECNSEGPA